MTSEAGDPRKALERERDRLDAVLEQNGAWRALRQLDAQNAEGRPVSAAETSALREHIEAALAGDRVYQARHKLSEAITLLGAPPAASDAEPSKSANIAESAPPHLPPAASPDVADDLTLIRGIDGALAARLNAIGVDSFAAVANWRAADVRRITDALTLERRIHRQNWIEQAALIVARRRPAATEIPPPPAPAPVAPAIAPSIAAARVDPIPAAQVADLVAAAVRAILAKVEPAVLPPSSIEPEPLADKPAVAAAAPAALAADDLTVIRGLDARSAKALADAGLTTFAAIARLPAADVAQLRTVLGAGAPLWRTQWIEQAAMLAAGQAPRHVRTAIGRAAIPLAPTPAATAVARDESFACQFRQPWAVTKSAEAPAAVPDSSSPVLADPTPAQPLTAQAPSEPASAGTKIVAVAVPPPQPVDVVLAPPAAFAVSPPVLQPPPEIAVAEPHNPAVAEVSLADLDPPDLGSVIDYNSDSLLDIVGMNFTEADVRIIPAASSLAPEDEDYEPRPRVYGSGAGSLQSRLRKAGDPDDQFDSQGYAAYRSTVEEASVEIVHRGGAVRTVPAADARPPSERGEGEPKTVRRFLKVLTGQDR